MTTAKSNLRQLAKQGNMKAIATLINRSFQSQGITAKVVFKNDCLQVMLESATQVPDQKTFVAIVSRGIANLQIESVTILRIFGKHLEEASPAWMEEIQIKNSMPSLNASDGATPDSHQISASSDKAVATAKSKASQENTSLSTPTSTRRAKLKWYETDSPALIAVLLIFFFPLGLWSMWRCTKWSLTAKSAVTGLIAIFLLANSSNEPSTEQSVASQNSLPPSELTQPGHCTNAAGNIWTNVRLYRDASCQRPFATIVGGDNGLVKILFDTGEIEIKNRSAVASQAYIRTDDPAIDAQVWLPLN